MAEYCRVVLKITNVNLILEDGLTSCHINHAPARGSRSNTNHYVIRWKMSPRAGAFYVTGIHLWVVRTTSPPCKVRPIVLLIEANAHAQTPMHKRPQANAHERYAKARFGQVQSIHTRCILPTLFIKEPHSLGFLLEHRREDSYAYIVTYSVNRPELSARGLCG